MLHQLTRAMTAGLVALAMAGTTGAATAAPESKDPIKVTLHDWTGQLITARIMGETLKKAGYNVDYVQADYLAQFAGMRTGDLHVAMEVWATTAKEAMDEAIAAGGVENVGETGMQAIEDWWFPEYMKEKCPGLPDWKALKECAEVFSTPETAPKGRYLGGPVTWGGYDEERVAALDLPFEVVHAGTDAAMFAELQSAYDRKAPILLWIYAPHWAPIKFKGEWIKFPPYEKACYEDPAWGVNKDAKYDCAKPRGPIYKAVWQGMKDKWPGAYKAVKAYTFDNKEIGELAAKVDLEGQKVEAVVDDWMAKNEDRWKKWIQ
ncbi:ABC transporter substrate-binding protein [Chenggangzhangella methanolivorans]|uniref:ABC transporter substrate-binding protein n=1 Tax=Chenggangzhangella methanolivorans TaxID=1437009 RepID=A0A9E6R949_9HYPH|nr:ABC transporter substrate-binding protein [Chenggangzhangella methanolivorans]QZO00374.1 ABC transporter substrate-binding protein [Chenggangzhangella methanolivorans]